MHVFEVSVQDAIIGALDVLEGEVPVDRLVQVALVDLLGNLRQLAVTAESFQLEEEGSRIFVNVPKESAVAVVDRTKRTIIAKWGLDWTFANYPMALDEEDKRLFVGCRAPA